MDDTTQQPPAWTPFQAFQTDPDGSLWYANSRYTVCARYCGNGALGTLVHLSIHDHERSARHDWREIQRIKNELCGPEAEGVEIYPPESRLVDTSNQYHVFVFLAGDRPLTLYQIGIGLDGGRLVSEACVHPSVRQRPWEEDTRPADLVPAEELLRRVKEAGLPVPED